MNDNRKEIILNCIESFNFGVVSCIDEYNRSIEKHKTIEDVIKACEKLSYNLQFYSRLTHEIINKDDLKRDKTLSKRNEEISLVDDFLRKRKEEKK